MSGPQTQGYTHLQIMYRILVNVEALNMVESIGNVTRRRTVPIIKPKGPGSYVIRWVPAVSGEALAHRYQLEVVELTKQSQKCKDCVDYWSEKGEFLKHFDLRFYAQQCQQKDKPKDWECILAQQIEQQVKQPGAQQKTQKLTLREIQFIEMMIVTNSVVEDIGGFMVEQGPTRRTSCVRFSYLIPTFDALEVTQLDHQMHVRSALKAETLRIKVDGREVTVQIPYYVQVTSAVYGGNIEVDLCCIGCYSNINGFVDDADNLFQQLVEDPSCKMCKDVYNSYKGLASSTCLQCSSYERRRIGLESLRPILEGDFGAKRSRYNPHGVPEIAIAVLSTKPIPTPPATLPLESLLEAVKSKVEAYKSLNVNSEVLVYITKDLGNNVHERLEQMVKDKLKVKDDQIASTIPEFIKKIVDKMDLKCSGTKATGDSS